MEARTGNNAVCFALQSEMRGYVCGTVNSRMQQQCYIEVKRGDGTQVTAATMEGEGNREMLRNVMNDNTNWSFGPFPFPATICVTMRHKRDRVWTESKVVGPLSNIKYPEPDYPMTFRSQQVVSEDLDNYAHDDCCITVLEYK
ncbi:hypothetical protein FRB94_001422 [Tulasnella sp. JGI-2019a]|nr:hypothetical protein FRB94_001422 [Tulasnella sp. JGI-2019a]KAG9006292.1 hypothetical protein FRB93_008781 [Tulasnella sp. JGI-2019a]KAG9037960.1 hypothetical protein FRB95_003353 [Tulasnella sp. JGI-2019a]